MAQQREGREWFVVAADFVDDEGRFDEDAFRAKVQDELAGLEHMGYRLGRGFMVTPLREPRQIGNVTVYETVGWAFSETFMPAVRRQESAPAEAELTPEEIAEHFPEPEPVGA